MENQILDKILEALQEQGALKQQVYNLTETIKMQQSEIVKLSERLGAQETITSVTNTTVCQIDKSLTEFKTQQNASNQQLLAEIQGLKDKPGKRWDNLISAIIAAVGTWAATRFLK